MNDIAEDKAASLNLKTREGARRESRLLTVFLTAAGVFLLLSAAIASPILIRPFYYAQIEPLALCEETGFSKEQIKTAYNEMLDYCLGIRDDFSTGELKWSESGKSHFTDCRTLFLLDLRVLCVSACAVLILLSAAHFMKLRPARIASRGPMFWTGSLLGGGFLLIGALAAIDFDRAFVVFHSLFFPGKDNWLFDPRTDEIILILPESFFMHCAILILGILLAGCAALIAADILCASPHNKKVSHTSC